MTGPSWIEVPRKYRVLSTEYRVQVPARRPVRWLPRTSVIAWAVVLGTRYSVLGTLLLALLPATAVAQRSLAIKRFDATIVVLPDASLDITESITAAFTGSWNGIYRTVPVDYHTPQGFNWSLRLNLLGATDQDGRALKVESARERHYIKYKIWVPGAENTTRTISFHYRAWNGLRFFADHDELYWNVTGDEWDVPIDAATAQIQLPPAASGVRAIAFNGAYGSTARDAKVDLQETAIRIAMPHGLGFHEGLTTVVGWNKGVVDEPTAADKAWGFLASNWPVGIPIAVFLGMFTLWWRVGRDPRRLPIVVQYKPPESLTPAETGTLVDESADMRDITATMVDLAVRGYLKIEEYEEEALFGLIKRREYRFHRLATPTGAPPLEPHEQRVLDGIFSSGKTVVDLSDLENEFYQQLPGIRQSIFDRLVSRKLYQSRPDKVRSGWLIGAVLLGFAIMFLGSAVAAKVNLTPLPFAVAAVLSGIIVAVFSRIMPARTPTGARALERTLGFEEFLRRVEEEHFKRMRTPEMFERYLPFAMAFKIERQWAKAFRDIYREPPTWYAGSNVGSFDMGRFSNRLADLSSRTESTMSSSPRSSGGSGFGGGGSSGGGGGGGGGGGF